MKPSSRLMKRPTGYSVGLGLGAVFLAGELFLGPTPLYEADALTEYRLKPNQSLKHLLPRLGLPLRRATTPEPVGTPSGEPTNPADPRVQQGLADLHAFLTLARASGARVTAVQFADRQEAATGSLQPANRWIAHQLRQDGVPSVQAGPIFRRCGPIASLYTDDIHPYTAAGQACLAQAIREALALGDG